MVARPPAAPLFAEPFYESDVAPTLPTAHVPSAAPVEEEPPTPAPPPEPMAADETVFEEATGPEEATTPPLASSTLAELYYRQGLADRAIDVYRQLLAEEPGNDKVRSAWRRSRPRGRRARRIPARRADGPWSGRSPASRRCSPP